MPKISVIVPVYNAEKILSVCVNSILLQSLNDFELILVNDGSSDDSGRICHMLAQTDSRIKVIQKENGGAASARNKGIDIATGEYISFIDGDDYVDADYLEILYNALIETGADLAVSGYFWESNGVAVKTATPDSTYTQIRYSDAAISGEIPNIPAFGPCCKLFKRNIISDYSVRFDERFKLSEDRIFNIDVMANIRKAVSIDYAGYHYVDNPTSLTHNRYSHSVVENIIRAEIQVSDCFDTLFNKIGIYKAQESTLQNLRTQAVLVMDSFISKSKEDGSDISTDFLYKSIFPLAKKIVSCQCKNVAFLGILKLSVAKNNIALLRLWILCMRIKRKISSLLKGEHK